MRFIPRPLVLVGFFAVVAVLMSLDDHVAVGWLIGGFVAGLVAGCIWWAWTRSHGLHELSVKRGSFLIAFGLLGALLLRDLPPELLTWLFAFGATLSLATAFPPKAA